MTVTPQSKRATGLSSLLLVSLAALFVGCSTPAVGDPCLPEQVPEDGFSDAESYIESSSVQCETRVCMVYKLRGAPKETGKCQDPGTFVPCPEGDNTCVEPVVCATKEEVEDRVYCTCRCDAGDTGFAECECPVGFTCSPVLEQGGPGVRGSYCVRKGT